MRDFMDHVYAAFYEATGWSRDNSYAALNAIPDGERVKPPRTLNHQTSPSTA